MLFGARLKREGERQGKAGGIYMEGVPGTFQHLEEDCGALNNRIWDEKLRW